jgi:hypothetical protein
MFDQSRKLNCYSEGHRDSPEPRKSLLASRRLRDNRYKLVLCITLDPRLLVDLPGLQRRLRTKKLPEEKAAGKSCVRK